jgi:hypothetical protein
MGPPDNGFRRDGPEGVMGWVPPDIESLVARMPRFLKECVEEDMLRASLAGEVNPHIRAACWDASTCEMNPNIKAASHRHMLGAEDALPCPVAEASGDPSFYFDSEAEYKRLEKEAKKK